MVEWLLTLKFVRQFIGLWRDLPAVSNEVLETEEAALRIAALKQPTPKVKARRQELHHETVELHRHICSKAFATAKQCHRFRDNVEANRLFTGADDLDELFEKASSDLTWIALTVDERRNSTDLHRRTEALKRFVALQFEDVFLKYTGEPAFLVNAA